MRRLLLSLGAVALLAACSNDDDGTNPTTTPSITLTASPSSGSIARGASGTTTLTLARLEGYAGAVALTAEGAPTGVTVAFAPQSLTGTTLTSTATISVGTTAAPGNVTLTFRATGSGVTDQTVTYALTIPAPAITLSVGGGTASGTQGGTATVPVSITRTNGATGTITLTAEGLPTGVTAAFAPASIPDGSNSSTLTLTIGAAAAAATTPFTVRAAATGVTDQTATVQLTVTSAATPAYTITAAPAALPVVAGQAGQSVLTITKTGGFAGNVALTLEGAPAGVIGTFTPNPATGTTSTLALNTAAATVPGVYNLTVRGAAAGLTDRTITIALTVTAPPGITVTLLPTTLSIAQGGNSQTAVTLARVGGLTGDIAMTATGAPAGMTTAFAPPTVTGTSSTLTVTVGAAVAVGTYNLTVTGTAGAVTGSAQLAVTVAAPSGFTLAATNASAVQGATGTSTITITRIGAFTGAVALTAANVPANVTPAFNPASATGATSTLTFTAAANATPGTYTVTVNGTGTGAANQSATLTLVITASGGGGGNVNWRFCDATRVPAFFAYRNGSTGAWTAVTVGANNTFSFTLTGATGSVAYVIPGTGGSANAQVYMQTTTELQAIASSECTTNQGTTTKSLSGTVAGLALLQVGGISIGSATAQVSGPSTTYTINNVPDRVVDLLAARATLNSTTFLPNPPDRGVIRRGVNYTGTVPLIDFAGSESFAMATATATIANAGSDQVLLEHLFITPGGGSGLLGFSLGAATTVPLAGVPSSVTQPGDLHWMILTAGNATATSSRSVIQYNRNLADRTYTLGSELALPTVTTTATAPYARIKTAGSWPTEYPTLGGASMQQTTGTVTRFWNFNASREFFGSGATTYEFEIPDFTGVSGFQNAWGFVTGSPVTVTTTFYGYSFGAGGLPQEGTAFKSASRTQTQTP